MKKLSLFLFVISIYSCSQQKNTKNDQVSTTSQSSKKSYDDNTADPYYQIHWKFSKTVDPVTSEKTNTAIVISDVLLATDTTAEGGNAALIIRKTGKETTIVLHNLNGDFTINSDGVKTKFNSEKPLTFNCSRAETHNDMFIEKTDQFIEKLKTSKVLLLQAELEDKGKTTFKFTTTGFKWDK